jgi:hypothetical protein
MACPCGENTLGGHRRTGRIVEALETLTPERVAEGPSGTNGSSAGRQDFDQVNRLAHHALVGAVWDKALRVASAGPADP